MSPRSPSMTTRPGCWRTSSHSQVDLHRVYGGVVPELASRDHVRRLLPLVRAALSRRETTPGAARWRRLHRRSGPHRRAADRRRARALAGLRLGHAGGGRASPRRPPAGAIAGARAAAVSAPGAAGVGRPHHAHRRLRARRLCRARRNARRCGRRSLRQVGQVVRTAVSRRARARRAGGRRARRGASNFRARCWIAPASNSASPASRPPCRWR